MIFCFDPLWLGEMTIRERRDCDELEEGERIVCQVFVCLERIVTRKAIHFLSAVAVFSPNKVRFFIERRVIGYICAGLTCARR